MPGSSYCYEVFSSANVNLLGNGASQSFSTLDATSSTAPLTFDVLGDLGETTGIDQSTTGVNEDQAAIDDEIGSSGAKFALLAGDIAYTGGTDTNYGDLTKTGSETSNIFGPAYWSQTKGIPVFAANGNHGQNITGLRTWPEEQTAAASGGTYAYDSYPANSLAGATSSPDGWYAFSDGGVRIYVLDAAWQDSTTYLKTTSATGSACSPTPADCEGYQLDDSEHWQPSSAEMEWLKSDLASHPGGIKMAVFHYPLASVQNNQPSDVYLQKDLEPVLQAGGVQLVFNGHAHTYQRIVPKSGPISYVTGGGGGSLEPVDGNSDSHGLCAAELKVATVYALGYSTKGSECTTGNTVNPTSLVAGDVYNFLKVTVSNGTVTVAPENALGVTFDTQTFQLLQGPPPTTTTTTTSTTTTTTTTGGGGGPVSFLQGATSPTKTVTLPNASRAGDLIALSASLYTGATNHITAISDSAGDVWKQDADANSSGHNSDGELWSTVTRGGATAITVTTGASNVSLGAQEFSGLGAAPAVTATATSNTSTTASSGSATASGLVVGFVAGHANAEIMTPPGAFVNQSQATTPSPVASLVDGYLLNVAGGTTYGANFGAAMYWSAGVAVFTP